jgi:hypothetical protein
MRLFPIQCVLREFSARQIDSELARDAADYCQSPAARPSSVIDYSLLDWHRDITYGIDRGIFFGREFMSFKTDHPNYKGYESKEFHVSDMPSGLSAALQGFIARECEGEHELKAVINDIAGRVPMEITTNWGWNYLLEDLPTYVSSLCRLPLPKVMDFLADLCTNSHLSFSAEGVNELLEGLDSGYVLEVDRWSRAASWSLRADVASRAELIEETTPHVKDICAQTLDHLNQAKKHLLQTSDDRDRKDAVRDCMSAMESMLKTLSGKSDIKDATAALRTAATWGPDFIVKDGLSLWDRMHSLYPDIRHGNPVKSNLPDEEALYWLERITCFIRYMSRVHAK